MKILDYLCLTPAYIATLYIISSIMNFQKLILHNATAKDVC